MKDILDAVRQFAPPISNPRLGRNLDARRRSEADGLRRRGPLEQRLLDRHICNSRYRPERPAWLVWSSGAGDIHAGFTDLKRAILFAEACAGPNQGANFHLTEEESAMSDDAIENA